MSIPHRTAVSRWAAQIDGPPEHRSMEGGNVFANGDTIYSYGHHFPMAHIVRDAKGKAAFVLVNGDNYSVTTAGHQSLVRGAIHGTGTQALVVPFTALKAAGIDQKSITPLEIVADTWTVNYRMTTVEQMASGYYAKCEDDGQWTVNDPRNGWENRTRIVCERQDDGRYSVPHFRHWLGEAIFKATVTGETERLATEDEIAQNLHTYVYGTRTRRVIVTRTKRTAKFLSAFDHNEARECYFLCELPRTKAVTVEEAFEALKPLAVVNALAAGLPVQRQGDIFAIPTSLTTRELKARAIPAEVNGWATNDEGQSTVVVTTTAIRKREILLSTNHTLSEVVVTKDGTYGRGTMRHEPGQWREADHARIKLGNGKGWFRILRNTVPQAKKDSRSNTGPRGTNQSGSARAWTMGGNVD